MAKATLGRWWVYGLSITLSGWALPARSAQGAPTTQPSTQPQPSATQPTIEKSSGGSGNDLTNMSLEDLMNVEVTTVSRQKQKISEAPAAVSVITADDIARSGLTTIPDLLRLAPGMDVARVNANTWAIGSRGFNDIFSNKLLVAMDGRTIYSPLFGGVFWDQQDYILQDIERIEVVRGPGATLWGANAVDGVINIQSKNARDTQGWLVSGLAGNQEQSGSVRYGAAIDDTTAFRVYTKYRHFDSFLDDSNGNLPRDQWESDHTGFRLDRNTSSQDSFTLLGEVYGEDLHETVKGTSFTAPFSYTTPQHGTADGGNILARFSHTVSPTSNMTLQVYYDRMDRYEGLYDFQQDTIDIDFQHRFAFTPTNELIWGLGYRAVWDRYNTDTLYIEGLRRDQLLQYTNAFVQDDLTLAPDRLHFIVGTKLEYNTYTQLEISPSGRLLYTPDEKNTFWGSIARGVRTPAEDEENERINYTAFVAPNGSTADVALQPNRHLKAEELLAYELGYRVRPTRTTSFDIAAFYNRYDNLVGTQNLTPQPTGSAAPPQLLIPVEWDNNLRGETYGGEFSATWNVNENWRLSGSYSFTEVMLHRSGANNSIREDFFEGTTPQQQVQLHSYVNLTRNVELNASAYYVSPLAVDRIPGYVRVDAGLVWRPTAQLELGVTVQNIFDNHHPEFTDASAYTLTSQSPRSIYGQLTYHF